MIRQTSSFQESSTGKLYLVPTPIGNLSDMTPRAVEVLQAVDLIAAEDTRNTQRLLNHFEITTPQISFHEYNTRERVPQLVAKLQAGENIAQVSDAGMPSISDPGRELVAACTQQGIPVIPLPGPNAALTALIASGIAPQPFLFYGFLPRKKGALAAAIAQLANERPTLIFYEAPHRLAKTLTALADGLGAERSVCLCRELTKRYEEFLRGTLADAVEWTKDATIRGEFVIIVAGNEHPTAQKEPQEQGSLTEQVDRLIASEHLRPTDAIKRVAKQNGLKKQAVYNEYHGLNKE